MNSLRIEAAREEMLRDMVNHNKIVLQKQQKAVDDFIAYNNPKYQETSDRCRSDYERRFKNESPEFIKKQFTKVERKFDEELDNYEPEYVEQEEGGIFFFDFGHPVISLLANWFANR